MKRAGPEEPIEEEPPLFRGTELPRVDDIARSITSYRDAVAAHFKAHPNAWISGLDLGQIGGAYAWRTRVSDCRLELGMTIANRVRSLPGGLKVSEYMYLPKPL